MKWPKLFTLSLVLLLSLIMASHCGLIGGTQFQLETPTMTATSLLSGAISSTDADSMLAALPQAPLVSPRYFSLVLNFWKEPTALASALCPIPTSTTNCSAAGSVMTLSLSSCGYPLSSNTWNGSRILTTTGVSPVCGTWPNSSSSLTAMTVTFGGTIPLGTETTVSPSQGGTVKIDTTTSTGFASLVSGGVSIAYGASSGAAAPSSVTLNGTNVQIMGPNGSTVLANRTVSSVAGSPITLSLSQFGTTNETKTVTGGTLLLQRNLSSLSATVTLGSTSNPIVFIPSCPFPVSGYLEATYSSGTLNGKSEIISFSSTCGQATVLLTDGSESLVTLPEAIN